MVVVVVLQMVVGVLQLTTDPPPRVPPAPTEKIMSEELPQYLLDIQRKCVNIPPCTCHIHLHQACPKMRIPDRVLIASNGPN
jgi:hypothetical protein